jgi:hypothetical protein
MLPWLAKRVARHGKVEISMKKIVLGIALSCAFAGQALAEASCAVQAADKKLAGAALKSFTKKCESDAKANCEKASADKKLAGAAKASFEKKCIADATAAK